MIADGAGFNTWKASAMYDGKVGKEFYDSPKWVSYPVSTYALRPAMPEHREGSLEQAADLVYDPKKAWDKTPESGELRGYPFHFAGYRWLREAYTDSANTMTAIVTGQKTYVGAVNVDGNGEPIQETIAWIAKQGGRGVGTVSSVLLSHATPAAGGGAHHRSRNAYCAIAVEMLTSPLLDLIAGCGHPEFDNNGEPIDDPARQTYRYVGGKRVWDQLSGVGDLRAGDDVCQGFGDEKQSLTAEEVAALRSWTLKESRSDIEKLTTGPTPSRLLIVARNGLAGFWDGAEGESGSRYRRWRGGALQQQRGSRADPKYTTPGYDPFLTNVPSLETLTRVALNHLEEDPDGFFLHVEGGAVDWAMHANELGRTIEEMSDFKRSIEAVVDWVDRRDAWDDTLVIVTSDHDLLLLGPRSDVEPFDPIRDNGAGRLPSYQWHSDHHSSLLVPLFARGTGAGLFKRYARRKDPIHGKYLDQTDIFRVMRKVLVGNEGADPR